MIYIVIKHKYVVYNYAQHDDKFNDSIGENVIVLKLERSNAIIILKDIINSNIIKNIIYSSNINTINKDLNYFFPIQDTFAMITPDAISKGNDIAILDRIKSEGFKIIEKEKILLTKEQAQQIYIEHKV